MIGSKIIFLLWLGLRGIVFAEPLEFFPNFKLGSQWNLKTIYRQIDGDWSVPISWRFKVEQENRNTFIVSVSGNTAERAELFFDKNTGQLNKILLISRIKGKEAERELAFLGPSPVYPLFSVIPFYSPVFLSEPVVSMYLLKRQINGRPSGSETLLQDIYHVDKKAILALWPDDTQPGFLNDNPESDIVKVQVKKKSKIIFEQFWLPDFPWAVYTASKNCIAWLER